MEIGAVGRAVVEMVPGGVSLELGAVAAAKGPISFDVMGRLGCCCCV